MKETTGSQTIERLYREHLPVDDEWSIRTAQGFRWWADRHAQGVEVIGEESGPDEVTAYAVSVRTEVFRELELTERSLAAMNALIMRAAATDWGRELRAKEAASGHPEHGRRDAPDEIVNVVPLVVIPSGRSPSRWKPAEFDEAVARYMQQPPALMANAGGAGLTVEFPYGDMSSLCRINADTPHPRYGSGLHVTQFFPLPGITDSDGTRLALAMNATELAYRPFGYGFGSYTFGDGMPEFVGFFANLVHKPGLLPNIYFSCAGRARAMSTRLMNAPWKGR